MDGVLIVGSGSVSLKAAAFADNTFETATSNFAVLIQTADWTTIDSIMAK